MIRTGGVLLICFCVCLSGCAEQTDSAKGGGGGGGGSGEGNVPLPACIKTLLDSCPLQGSCTVETSGDSVRRSCFESGVKVVSNKGSECSNSDEMVYASDGSLCYSRTTVAYAAHACEQPVTTWTDSTGTMIATETSQGPTPSHLQITCAGGEHAECFGSGTCGWDELRGANCDVGACL